MGGLFLGKTGVALPFRCDQRARIGGAALEENPFAAVALAQLKELETPRAPAERWRWKVRLLQGLYDRGWGAEHVRQLLCLLDQLLE